MSLDHWKILRLFKISSYRYLCIALFTVSAVAVYSQSRSVDLLPINYFNAGEYARYKIIYKFSEAWVTAGHLNFEISERAVSGKRHLVCVAKANTTPAFDLFYKVRDEYATVMDPITLVPKFFLRRVNEGGFKISNDLDFHHDSLFVTADVEDSKTMRSSNTYPLIENTQDIISAILYCRTLNYKALDSGNSYQFPLFIDNELHHIGIRYLGVVKTTTEYGEYDCIVLQPFLLTGRVFAEADQMRIYITDDAQRVPVYIESPLRVGKIVGVLIKYRK
jgi:hypothetical protein